jgi:hypothetical protein
MSPPGATPFFQCLLAVFRVGVRDVQRTMEFAVRVATIEDVGSFRSLVVALLHLGSGGICAESDFVGLEDFSFIQKLQFMSVLED